MSNKYVGLYVTFEKEISQESLETAKQLIGLIKGVISIKEGLSDIDHWFAREQAKHELTMKFLEMLK